MMMKFHETDHGPHTLIYIYIYLLQTNASELINNSATYNYTVAKIKKSHCSSIHHKLNKTLPK